MVGPPNNKKNDFLAPPLVFKPFFAKGFNCPREPSSGGGFFTTMGWRLVTSNLGGESPQTNSIVLITMFIHFYESFLDISAHLSLWRALYQLKSYPSKKAPNIVEAPLSLRQGWSTSMLPSTTTTRSGRVSGLYIKPRSLSVALHRVPTRA